MNRRMSDERLDAALREVLADEAERLAASALTAEAMTDRLDGRVHPGGLAEPLRLAWLVLLTALLLTALAVGLVLGQLRPNPDELVRRSMEVHAAPPPFVMTVAHDPLSRTCSLTRYVYDGAGRLRTECYWDTDDLRPATAVAVAAVQAGEAELPEGLELWQYTVRGGAVPGQMLLDTGAPEWIAGQGQDPQPPEGLPHWTLEGLNWHGWVEGTAPRAVTCADWLLGPMGSVADRPARAVRCGEVTYWIDEASALLVRIEVTGAVRAEALALQVGGVPPGLAFGPAPTARLPLAEGRPAPDWTLPLADGGELSPSSLQGRPLVVMWPIGCGEPCLDPSDLHEVLAGYPELDGLIVIDGTVSAAEALAATAGDIPVVIDDGSRQAWSHWQPFAFIAADGTVAGFSEARSLATLEAAVDALLRGAPIPTPPPGDGTLTPGQPVPALAAALVGGGRIEPADLAGQSVVVLIPPPAPCIVESDAPGAQSADTAFHELVTAFADVHRELHDRAAFVLVGTLASRRTCYSPDMVDWPAILDDLRATAGPSVDGLSVIDPQPFWTEGDNGMLTTTWGALTAMPTLVMADADGRLVQVVGEGALDDLHGLIRDALGG